MHRLGVTRSMLRHAVGWRLLAAALLACLLTVPAAPAQANGTPVRIVLSYLNGVSNFGPQNATGVAELITSEGEVRLQAAGLQKLGENEEYRLWISSTAANQRMPLGAVEIGESGVARMDIVLKSAIPEQPWDLMVITVEQKGQEPAAPSDKRSIAGRFSMTPGEGQEQPRQLPNTGGEVPAGMVVPPPASGTIGLSMASIVLLLLLMAGGAGYVLGRVGSRRSA